MFGLLDSLKEIESNLFGSLAFGGRTILSMIAVVFSSFHFYYFLSLLYSRFLES